MLGCKPYFQLAVDVLNSLLLVVIQHKTGLDEPVELGHDEWLVH